MVSAFVMLLLLGEGEPSSPASIRIETVDGKTHAGRSFTMSAESVELIEPTKDAPSRLPVDQIMRIQLEGRLPARVEAPFRVALRGSGILLARQYLVSDDAARLTLTSGLDLRVPLSGIDGVLCAPAVDKDAVTAWLRAARAERTSDVLVAVRGNERGELEGTLGEFNEEKLAFLLDGEQISVRRDRIHALYYAHQQKAVEPIAEVVDVHGNVWPAESLTVSPERILAKTAHLGEVSIPYGELDRIDYSKGRVLFLSDVEPASNVHVPFFDQQWPMQRDANFTGLPIKIGSATFSKGLVIHSKTTLRYDLDGAYRRFVAVVGMESAGGPLGNADVRILADDEVLWERNIRAGQEPESLDLAVDKVRQLVIIVDYGAKADLGDHVGLGDARIVK